jgi:hypothetical protein
MDICFLLYEDTETFTFSKRVLLTMAILYPAKVECWISTAEWQDSFSVAGFCPVVKPLRQVNNKVVLLREVLPILGNTFRLVWQKTQVFVEKHFEDIRPYQQLSLQL